VRGPPVARRERSRPSPSREKRLSTVVIERGRGPTRAASLECRKGGLRSSQGAVRDQARCSARYEHDDSLPRRRAWTSPIFAASAKELRTGTRMVAASRKRRRVGGRARLGRHDDAAVSSEGRGGSEVAAAAAWLRACRTRTARRDSRGWGAINSARRQLEWRPRQHRGFINSVMPVLCSIRAASARGDIDTGPLPPRLEVLRDEA